jgi:electron transport complex protein RnfB
MLGVLIFTSISFVLSVILVSIHSILNREELMVERIERMLPGYNCGACGFTSCLGMAEKIVQNKNNLKKCKPITEEQYQRLEAYLENK